MFVPVFEGKVAITSFFFSVASILVITAASGLSFWTVMGIEAIYLLSLMVIMFSLSIVKVVLCSHLLGVVFATGSMVAITAEAYCYFGVYATALSFFHFSEYIVTSIFNSHTLSIDSFLLNHSREYAMAAVASWLEYWIEFYFFPGLKSFHYVSILGALMVLFGESLRKVAMITAGSNFSHIIQYRKKDDHKLVTTGVYSLFRHPSYVGWFYWSIGTQILLCNPVCLLGYTVASWFFFKERIEDEEENLIMFFGQDYIEYKEKIGTGIPFNYGYPMNEAISLLKYRIK